MKKVNILIIATVIIIGTCSWGIKKSELRTRIIEVQGHEYIVFKYDQSSSIAVLHSENCPCKK